MKTRSRKSQFIDDFKLKNGEIPAKWHGHLLAAFDAGQRDTDESLTRQLSTAKAALEAIQRQGYQWERTATERLIEVLDETIDIATKALEDIKNGNS